MAKRRRRKIELPEVEKLKYERREENLPTSLMGIPVRSKEEARVGVGLGFLGWYFNYQVRIFGGADFRGGQIIDFLVFTVPLPTPLYVQSVYWHGPTMVRGDKDKLNQARVRRAMSGAWLDPREIWDYEATSVEHAVSTLRSMFGRNF